MPKARPGSVPTLRQDSQVQLATHDAIIELKQMMQSAKSPDAKLAVAGVLLKSVDAYSRLRESGREQRRKMDEYRAKYAANGAQRNGHATPTPMDAPREPEPGRPAPTDPTTTQTTKESLSTSDRPHPLPTRGSENEAGGV